MPIAKFQLSGAPTPRRKAKASVRLKELSAHDLTTAMLNGKQGVAVDPATLSDKLLDAIAASPHVGRKWKLSDLD